jgi:transposase InsO family protein
MPERLHSDRGANFTGKVITEMCQMLGIKRSTTTSFHPMGNGSCERQNQTLLNLMGTLPESKKSRWKDYVAPLVHAYNCTRSDVTGYTPFELMFGRTPRLPIDHQFGLNDDSCPDLSCNDYIEELKENLKRIFEKNDYS